MDFKVIYRFFLYPVCLSVPLRLLFFQTFHHVQLFGPVRLLSTLEYVKSLGTYLNGRPC